MFITRRRRNHDGGSDGILPEITQIVTNLPATHADIPITLADCTGSDGASASFNLQVNGPPGPGDYIVFGSPTQLYYAWFTVDGVGDDPAPGGEGIQVNIAFGEELDSIASDLSSAIDGNGYSTFAAGAEVGAQAFDTGNVSSAPAGSGDNITVTSFSDGAPSSISNYQGAWITLSYFQLSGTTWIEQQCYLWFNANGESIDPGIQGQGIEIAGFGYGELGSDILATIPIDLGIAGFGGKWTFSSHWTAVIGGDHSGQGVFIDKWGGISGGFPATFGTITYGANNGYREGDAISFNVPGAAYYLWYQIAGTGTNPSIAGKTGFLVATAQADTAAQVATKTKTVIDTNLSATITTAISSNTLTLTNVVKGPVTDANKRATNFTITVTQQGS